MRFWRTASGGAIGPRTSAAIGDDIDVLDIEKGAGRLGGLFQQHIQFVSQVALEAFPRRVT